MALHSKYITYLLTATVFAVMQASCYRNEPLESEIVMSASLTETRALINSKSDMVTQSRSEARTGFGVFGYKTNDDRNQQIFNNTKVSIDIDNTTEDDWRYSPKKFWDRSAYYHFVAYWPHSESNVSHDEPTHTLTMSGIPNWQPTSTADDILLAYSQNSAKNYFQENEGIVPFTFQHMLAKVIINAWYYGNETNQPFVTDITVGGNNEVAKQGKNSSFSYVYEGRNDPVYTVNDMGTAALLSNSSVGVTAYYETEADLPEGTERNTTTICSWLAIPYGTAQTNSAPISISYKFGEAGSVQSKDGNVPLGHLTAGNTYVVTLKFDTSGERLNLQAIIVKKWIEGTGSTPSVYNW